MYYWIGMGYQNCTEAASILPPQDCPGALLSSLLDARALFFFGAITLAAQEYDGNFGAAGFREDHALNLCSSRDLVKWTFRGNALQFPLEPTLEPSPAPNALAEFTSDQRLSTTSALGSMSCG